MQRRNRFNAFHLMLKLIQPMGTALLTLARLLQRTVLLGGLGALHVGGLENRAGEWIDLRHISEYRPHPDVPTENAHDSQEMPTSE